MRSFVKGKLAIINFALLPASTIWKYMNAINLYVPQKVNARCNKSLWMTNKALRCVWAKNIGYGENGKMQ